MEIQPTRPFALAVRAIAFSSTFWKQLAALRSPNELHYILHNGDK